MKSSSVGTQLKINSKPIGALKSIGGIEISAESIDVTDLSNKDGYREFLAGFKDAGEVSFSGLLDGTDEGQNECYTLMVSGEVVDCEIVFPQKIGKTWSFKGCITKFATNADLEDAVGFEGAIKVSGKPTLGATAEAAG